MGKLNLFRKGRGKEYRQTKRAIKKEIRKTGGFTGTAGAEGKFTITGGSGAIGGSQSGWARRNLARGAAESMTSGIDKIADLGGSDTQTYGGGVAPKKKKTITKGASKGAYSWTGEGITAGVTTTASSDVPVTGPTAENVQGQITELEKDNPKISMKSSAFKMKYSPFNQGYGSPLNWNERSPLNDLNKDGELVQSTKGQYMKEDSALPCNDCGDSSPLHQSSPLNDKESCEKKGGKWENGACTTTTKSTKDVELENLAEGETGGGTATTTGSTTESEAKSKSEQNCTPADRTAAYAQCKNRKPGSTEKACTPGKPKCCYGCAKAGSKEELEETKKADVECNDDQKKVKKEGGGYKCVKDESKSQTEFAGDFKEPDTDGSCDEGFKKVTVNGETKCQKGEKDTKTVPVTTTKEKKGKIKTRCKSGFKPDENGNCVKEVKKEKGEVSEKKDDTTDTDDTGDGKKGKTKKVCVEWKRVSVGSDEGMKRRDVE